MHLYFKLVLFMKSSNRESFHYTVYTIIKWIPLFLSALSMIAIEMITLFIAKKSFIALFIKISIILLKIMPMFCTCISIQAYVTENK